MIYSNERQIGIYLNKGQFRFEDITTSSGFEFGNGYDEIDDIFLVDIDGNGLLDIYVLRSGLAWNTDSVLDINCGLFKTSLKELLKLFWGNLDGYWLN